MRRDPLRFVQWRAVRTSTFVALGMVGAIDELGVRSYAVSSGANPVTAFAALLKNPAFVALYGPMREINSPGALVQWKMSAFTALFVALWSALLATRLTREAEDDGRYDLLVVGNRSRRDVFVATATTLTLTGLALGTVSSLVLLLAHQRVADSLSAGAGLAGVAWAGAGAGLVTAQCWAPRRAASQAAVALVALWFALRMLGDAAHGLAWCRNLSPLGWNERVAPFNGLHVWWLLANAVAAALGIWFAQRLEQRRDVGAARWRAGEASTRRSRLLGGPWGFALHQRRSLVVGWGVALAAWGALFGYLTKALVDSCRSDPALVRLLDKWGFASMATGQGFLADVALIMAAILGLFVVASLAPTTLDEREGRLDLVWSTGVAPSTWFAASQIVTALAAVLLSGLFALCFWVSCAFGNVAVPLPSVLAAMANALVTVPLILGVGLWGQLLAPRVLAPILYGWVGASYLVMLLGPALGWPGYVNDLSLFHHLGAVPVQPVPWTAVFVLLGAGVLASASGLVASDRRDTVSG